MYLGRDFPPFENQAARVHGVDLSELLAPGEAITAVTGRLRTVSGIDLLPATHLPVPAVFAGAAVSQMVAFNDPADLLLGNTYVLSFLVTTSAGRVLQPWARLTLVRGFGVTAYAGGAQPSGAQSIVLRAAPLFFTIPTLQGGYAGQDLPTANQGETLSYGFDFSAALAPAETILTVAAFLAILVGTDAAVTGAPDAYAVGAPRILGNAVTQKLAWANSPDLTANVYALNITAGTSYNQALNAWSRISIDAPN